MKRQLYLGGVALLASSAGILAQLAPTGPDIDAAAILEHVKVLASAEATSSASRPITPPRSGRGTPSSTITSRLTN